MLLGTADNRTFPPEAGCIGLAGWMPAGRAQRPRLSKGGVNKRRDVTLKWKSEWLLKMRNFQIEGH